MVKRELPKDKKIIILSATIPIFIYQKLFGERFNVIDIRDVEQVGKVLQHTNRSCSRSGLSKYVKDISEEVGEKPLITIKSFAHHFQNPVEGMHFGNTSCYDSLKGQNIVVVGTPHLNNVAYLLTAKALNIDLKTTNTLMTYKKISTMDLSLVLPVTIMKTSELYKWH